MNRDSRLHGLYAITDGRLQGEKLYAAVSSALNGGVRLLQYRDKSTDAERRLQEATELQHLCQQADCLFIVNDDPQLARRVDADGVHIGQSDAKLAHAREQLGPKKLIGVSCNNRLDRARAAQSQGADYVAFGRFFASVSKPDAPQAELSLLQTARQEIHLPIVAIGGITPENAGQLLDAGADMLAVINGIFGQNKIEEAARRLDSIFIN